MIIKPNTTSRSRGAFSLIELIGVLAVIAILAAVLVPVLIRQMDQVASEQESASLKSIVEALKQAVLRNRYIPAYTNWSSTVATELGVSVPNVTTTSRNQTRFFLVDPTLSVGGAGLPYQQSDAGAGSAPVNPRMIVLASVGQRLTGMASGVPSVADFNAIWNWVDGSSTPPAASGFSGFTRGEDLKVQRLDLSPSFVHLILTSYASNTTNGYSIDSTNFPSSHVYVSRVSGIDRYFIQSSALTLYGNGGAIDSQQILIADSSFVYNQNVWSTSIFSGVSVGGLDLTGVADRFLKAPPNLNINVPYRANQQGRIVTNMMTYMTAYNAWAASGFSSAAKAAATSAQAEMILSLRQIFEPGGGSNDYTPVNTDGCVTP